MLFFKAAVLLGAEAIFLHALLGTQGGTHYLCLYIFLIYTSGVLILLLLFEVHTQLRIMDNFLNLLNWNVRGLKLLLLPAGKCDAKPGGIR